MKSDEIRDAFRGLSGEPMEDMPYWIAKALAETAAQLAELNVTLKAMRVDNGADVDPR